MPTPIASITLRPAVVADLPAINDIYNHYVLNSTCTYQEVPETPAGREAWFARHGETHPVIVAVDAAGTIRGWGSLSAYHARSAYRFTVENSVYIQHDLRGKGLGKLLLAELIRLAQQAGQHCIIAGIDADQEASVALHARFGFEQVGRLKQVGFKFGRWLDVIYMQLVLTSGRQES
jgi:L-amino acid N-acyltransferase YncA